MGAFDGELCALGYASRTRIEKRERRDKVEPEIGGRYTTSSLEGRRTLVTVIATTDEFVIMKLDSPKPKKFDIGFHYEASHPRKTLTLLKLES